MQNSFGEIFRKGFILGLGMLIPLVVVLFISNVVNYKISNFFYSDEAYSNPYKSKEEDHIKSIQVQSFHDTREGDFVMVIGKIKNSGKEKVSSIKLEAEFFNEKGEFVYEESEFISKSLAPNEEENFVIKCGCTKRKFPEYSKVTVKVVGANAY
ncbi:hypothetical protein [Undibacterium sp. Di24W]|uniref:hypothetical protein n=1 Tax=Undibacterium sp. Di24W TaxID=3413033 RepID=UPI003BF083C5